MMATENHMHPSIILLGPLRIRSKMRARKHAGHCEVDCYTHMPKLRSIGIAQSAY